MTRNQLLYHAQKAAQKAGSLIRTTPLLEIHHKGNVDLVTQVDIAAETLLREYFTLHTPHIPILAEEGGGATGTTRWIIDPLDGTTNFAHGIPHFCISIALEQEGELVVGVVYDPSRDELYSAAKEMGATCNDTLISVSTIDELNHALVGTGFPYNRRETLSLHLNYIEKALLSCQGLRRIGSAALDLCYLAHGRLDAFWEFNLNPWDVAAGIVIIQEAGGVVSTFHETPYHWRSSHIVACNRILHKKFCAMLREV